MTRVVLIVGNGYSGSTLLSMLLNAHPGIATVGEMTGTIRALDARPETYPCSCGEELGSCPFWKDIQERMHTAGLAFGPRNWDMRFDVGRNRVLRHLLVRSLRHNGLDRVRDRVVARLPGVGPRLDEVLKRNVSLIRSIVDATGSTVFVDASKDPRRARYLARADDVDLRVLHLVRDAPGYVASARKNRDETLLSGIRAWNRGGRQVERLLATLPDAAWMQLRYEDLCRNPQHELDRVAAFCGLEPSSAHTHFRDVPHHIIGNRMRLGGTSEVRVDEAWRARLNPPELAQILAKTARLRRSFGYPVVP